MVEKAEDTANAIIQQALQNAGVPPRNIELPPAEAEPALGVPTLDGGPKGPVKGESPEEKVAREAAEALGTAPAKPAEPKPGEPVAQPLDKAGIEAILTEATSKFQSLIDRKINQLNYQMQQTIGALNQFFQAQENPDLSSLPAEEQIQKRLERLEKPSQPKIQIQPEQQPDAAAQQLYQYLSDMADVAGIKIDDKRLDWGSNLPVTSASDIIKRFKTSVKQAFVEDQVKAIKELKDNGDKLLANVRKKTGVDRVSTSGPGGEGIPDISKMSPMDKIEYGFRQQEELAQANK